MQIDGLMRDQAYMQQIDSAQTPEQSISAFAVRKRIVIMTIDKQHTKPPTLREKSTHTRLNPVKASVRNQRDVRPFR